MILTMTLATISQIPLASRLISWEVAYDNDARRGLLQKKSLMAFFSNSKAFKEITEISQKISPSYQLGLNLLQIKSSNPISGD